MMFVIVPVLSSVRVAVLVSVAEVAVSVAHFAQRRNGNPRAECDQR
jgi:hypothetical protein